MKLEYFDDKEGNKDSVMCHLYFDPLNKKQRIYQTFEFDLALVDGYGATEAEAYNDWKQKMANTLIFLNKTSEEIKKL